MIGRQPREAIPDVTPQKGPVLPPALCELNDSAFRLTWSGVSTMKSLPILALFALSACGQERVRLAPVPVELTTCAAEPAAPDLPGLDGTLETQRARDGMVLDYILRLRGAWGDCASKISGVAEWNKRLH